MSQYQDIRVGNPDGPMLCALINGAVGWLMYLRYEGDAGLSSRNPDYAGSPDAQIEYVLSNGQMDRYPAAWALPATTVMEAIDHFRSTGGAAPFVIWHDDAHPA